MNLCLLFLLFSLHFSSMKKMLVYKKYFFFYKWSKKKKAGIFIVSIQNKFCIPNTKSFSLYIFTLSHHTFVVFSSERIQNLWLIKLRFCQSNINNLDLKKMLELSCTGNQMKNEYQKCSMFYLIHDDISLTDS